MDFAPTSTPSEAPAPSKKSSSSKKSKSKSSSSSSKSKISRKLDLPRPEPEDNPQASAQAHEQMMQDLAGSMAPEPARMEEGGGFGADPPPPATLGPDTGVYFDAGIEPYQTQPYYGKNDNDDYFLQEIDSNNNGDATMMDISSSAADDASLAVYPQEEPVESFEDPSMFATLHADPDMTFMGQPYMELCEFWTMGRKGGIVISQRYDTAGKEVRATLNFAPSEEIRIDSLVTDRAYAWPLGQPQLASTKAMYMEEELTEASLWTGFFSLRDFERAHLFPDGSSVRALNDCIGTSRDGCMTVCAVAGNRAQAVELMKHMLCMMYRSNLDSNQQRQQQQQTDELLERLIETRVQCHNIVPQIMSW